MASTKSTKKNRRQVNFQVPLAAYQILSLLLIILGSSLIFWASSRFITVKFAPNQGLKTTGFSLSAPKPQKLYIPKLGKVFYVSEGQAEGDRWAIAETGVSYLSSSALPGTLGNTVMYGHNKDDIFGYLYLVKAGDPVYAILDNGHFVKFTVAEEKEVTPKDVQVLEVSNDSRLTLFTCSGFLDSARFVVVAKQDKII